MSEQTEQIDTSSGLNLDEPVPPVPVPAEPAPEQSPPKDDSKVPPPSVNADNHEPPSQEAPKDPEPGRTKARKPKVPAKREAKTEVVILDPIEERKQEQPARQEKTKAIGKENYDLWLQHRQRASNTVSQIRSSLDQLARLSKGQRLGR